MLKDQQRGAGDQRLTPNQKDAGVVPLAPHVAHLAGPEPSESGYVNGLVQNIRWVSGPDGLVRGIG